MPTSFVATNTLSHKQVFRQLGRPENRRTTRETPASTDESKEEVDLAAALEICNWPAQHAIWLFGAQLSLVMTSEIPGRAVKATDQQASHGAILGKSNELAKRRQRACLIIVVTKNTGHANGFGKQEVAV